MKTKADVIKFANTRWLPGVLMGAVLIILGILSAIGGLVVGCVVLVILGILYAYIAYEPQYNFMKTIKQIEKDGEMDILLGDFIDGRQYSNGEIICGETFMIGKHTGSVTKYSDMVKVYERVEKRFVVVRDRGLVAETNKGKTVLLGIIKSQSEQSESMDLIEDILKEIAHKNFAVQFGYKPE